MPGLLPSDLDCIAAAEAWERVGQTADAIDNDGDVFWARAAQWRAIAKVADPLERLSRAMALLDQPPPREVT